MWSRNFLVLFIVATLTSASAFALNAPPTVPVDIEPSENSVAPIGLGREFSGIRVQSTDPEGLPIVYSLLNTAGSRFIIDATFGGIFLAQGAMVTPGSTYTVTVQASDGVMTTTRDFTIGVDVPPSVPIDVNPAPNAIAENAPAGTPVGIRGSAVDPDGATIVFNLDNPSDPRFLIDYNTGEVYLAPGAVLNFQAQSTHVVTILASNNISKATQAFVINVLPANQPMSNPVDINLAQNRVPERSATGTEVGIQVQSVDPDAGTVLTYAMINDAGGRFAIDATTGIVTVVNGSLLDYEAAKKHAIKVSVSGGGFTKTIELSIDVTDLNEGVSIQSFTATPVSVAVGMPVTFTVAATDLDGTVPSVRFDYGDGSTGVDAVHVYPVRGQYRAVATVSDGEFSATASVIITVIRVIIEDPLPEVPQDFDFNGDGFVGPMDKDSDVDGVPDAMEVVLGTNPNDATDSPLSQTQAVPFRMEKQKATFSSDVDKVEFKGVLHVRAGLDPAGKVLAIDAGGNVRRLELDGKGRFQDADIDFQLKAKLNEKRAKEAKFSLKITGRLLANLIANAPKDEAGRPARLTAHILFDGVLLIQTKELRYRK